MIRPLSALAVLLLSASSSSFVSAAPTAATKDSAPFYLKTSVTNGNSSFNGLFVSTYHTGAAEDAAIVTASSSSPPSAPQFVLQNSSYLVLPLQSGTQKFYEFFHLDAFRPKSYYDDGAKSKPAAPKGYYYVDISVDSDPTSGFKLVKGAKGKGGKVVEYEGSERPKFATFAVCSVTDSLGGNGSGDELLWRSSDVKADETGRCADVVLDVVYA